MGASVQQQCSHLGNILGCLMNISDELVKNVVIWRSGEEAVGQVLVAHEGPSSDLQHSCGRNRNHGHEKPGSAVWSSQRWGREARGASKIHWRAGQDGWVRSRVRESSCLRK